MRNLWWLANFFWFVKRDIFYHPFWSPPILAYHVLWAFLCLLYCQFLERHNREVLLYNTLFRRKTCWTNHLLLQLCHLMAFDHLDGSHVPGYGNTGCRVFKWGVQNWKDFCLKINIPKESYWMNVENWCNGEVSKIGHHFTK